MVFAMSRPQRLPDRRFPISRKVVPKDLRGILGRTEFRKALRGTTEAENKRRHLELTAKWEAQIAAARAEKDGQVVRLNARRVAELAGYWYREEVAFWEDDVSPNQEWATALDNLRDQEGPSVRDREAAIELTRDRGLAVDRDTSDRLAAAVRVQRAQLYRLMQRRADGDWSADTHLDRLPQTVTALADGSSITVTFDALLDRWAAEVQPPAKSLDKSRAAFRNLSGVIGHDDARSVSTADVRAWKEARLGAGRSLKTVADGIAGCRSVVNWSIKNGFLDGPNPFSGLAPKLPKHGLSARDGYTNEEARTLLEAARKETGWLRWLPFVLAYTGARIEEVAEARRRDVRQEGGVWVLDVVPTASRRLKTAHAQRMIPLHPALQAEGLLAYVAGLPEGPLFPDLAPGRYGSRGSTATKTHSRWVRGTVGITDRRKAPAHSWRHRLEDQLRIAWVPTEAQDAITGHDNPRNAGAGYGRGLRRMPAEVASELAKLPVIVPVLT